MDIPPAKRVKLEPERSPPLDPTLPSDPTETEELEDADGEHCSICLQPYADRTVIPTCSHEFCFECLLIWTEQSRRCPLCSQDIGRYLMHHIRSKYDYQKHYLAPLRTSPEPQGIATARQTARQRAARRREVEWGRRRRREIEELDELERAIEKRRWVYRHRLYAKHVASNPYTRYRPFPTPAQFAASQDYISRATIFIRRELRVWTGLDVEFLTTFTVSLMKSLDIRSEPAVRLLSEFLDMDADRGHDHDNAEHFAHELYCYLRSPYRDLAAYDQNVQYDVPADVSPPDARIHRPRWHSQSLSPSPPGSRMRIRSPSRSPSPPHAVAGGSRALSRNVIDLQLHETSVRHASPRHAPRETKDMPQGVGPSRDSRSDDRYHSRQPTGRRSRSRGTSPSGGVASEQRHLPLSSRNSRHPGNKYDGKGKRRAEDRADDLDSSHPASSHDEEVMTARGDPDAGMQWNVNNNMPSRARSENEATSSTLSTPPRTTDLSAAISQSAKSSSFSSRVASPIRDADKATNPGELPSMSGESGEPIVSLKEGKAPVRLRRNPWQTMQHYLSNGINGSRSSRHDDRTSGAELTSQAQSQAQGDKAVKPRDEALRPEDSSPSDEAVPSLLLRLSDPSPPTPASSHYASSEVPDAVRGRLPIHEEGKRISAPEIMARTRARLARMSAVDDRTAGSSPPPNVQHPGGGRLSNYNRNAVQGSDVGTVEHMSSEDAAQSKGGTGTARISAEATPILASADPRSLLLQKLAAEKRNATDIPTAEKEQLSSSRRSTVPMVLSDGSAGEPSKSALEVVAAERITERREAELRSQAQLRVRLAAAKRAANAAATPAAQGCGASVEGGTEGSSAMIDGDLAAQESSLRSRLRSRQR